MAFQPALDTLEVAIQCTLAGEACINTFHYMNTDSWGTTEADILCNDIATLWTAFTPGNNGTQFVFSAVKYKGLRTATDITGVVAVAPVTGTVAGAQVPNNSAISIARLTGLAGRSNRGRVYMPVTVAANMTGANQMSTSAGAVRIALLNDMRDVGTADGWTHVLVSRQQDGVIPANAVLNEVLYYSIRDYVLDSQRRRLPLRGI